MPFGGFGYYPRRLGGGKPRGQYIIESLNKAMGSGYDTTQTSNIYARNMATARALDAAFGTNQRLANQFDPTRMSECLSRWETIFGLVKGDTDSLATRRARVATQIAKTARLANASRIVQELQVGLGALYVALEFIDYSLAVIHVPDGTYPWGTASVDTPWYSTTAHILVRLTKPSGYTEAQFYEAAGNVQGILDPLVPVWVSYDWYRAPETGAAVAVAGGPSAAGFYLDERNLDNSCFDV